MCHCCRRKVETVGYIKVEWKGRFNGMRMRSVIMSLILISHRRCSNRNVNHIVDLLWPRLPFLFFENISFCHPKPQCPLRTRLPTNTSLPTSRCRRLSMIMSNTFNTTALHHYYHYIITHRSNFRRRRRSYLSPVPVITWYMLSRYCHPRSKTIFTNI